MSIKKLKRYLQKKQAKKCGLSIESMKNIASNTYLEVELPASLGETKLSSAGYQGKTTFFGAYSYIHSGELAAVRSVGRYCFIDQAYFLRVILFTGHPPALSFDRTMYKPFALIGECIKS